MINFSCRYFLGSKPCSFNKLDGSECTCSHFSSFQERILFIKLDAMGDVLRSASLLPAIIDRHSSPYIAWLTRPQSAELVNMMPLVDEVIELNEVGLFRLKSVYWDQVYSLSNDIESASIASVVRSQKRPIGYYIENGSIKPSNAAALAWLELASFDRLKKLNVETYQKRMLAIIDASDTVISPPVLDISSTVQQTVRKRLSSLLSDSARPRVAINLGAGGRWPKKMLTVEQIGEFVSKLHHDCDVDILMVGGVQEEKKAALLRQSRQFDERVHIVLTADSIIEFVALLNEMDVLLCGDTLALHVATALSLPTIAIFGPTSEAEIYDFDGLVLKTHVGELDCLCCYGDCTKERNCISLLSLDLLVELTKKQLSKKRRFR